ncbi:MAG: hypothetical protein AAGJ18_00175 [Bacteroidota bacterium]
MTKSLTILVILSCLILAACYEEKAIEPEVSIQFFYLDENKQEVEFSGKFSDSVPYTSNIIFRAVGLADKAVLWSGDRRVSVKGAEFEFTPEAYDVMLDSGVPTDIVESLRSLEGEYFPTEKQLRRKVFGLKLVDRLVFEEWAGLILEPVFKPLAGADGRDSFQFIFNHSYEDFLVAEERGYYNVSGIEMSKRFNTFTYEKNGFPKPGTFSINVLATSVGAAGKETVSTVATRQLELVQ